MTDRADFISSVVSAMANHALYSGEHPVVKELCQRAFASLQQMFIKSGSLSITLLGNVLVLNDEQMTARGLHIDKFISRLKRRRIDKVVISRDVSSDELLRFIYGLSSSEELHSGPNISLGTMEVGLKSDGLDARDLDEEYFQKLRRIFGEIREGRALDTAGLDDLMIGMISALRREADILKLLSPVRSLDEYTYVHATNVSVLTIFQAQQMGISGELLYDIGLAALMHDVGKMFISDEILEKRSALDAGEWELMKLHPVYGARYLTGISGIPKLALIAAYEHHQRYDGSGYPGSSRHGSRQHIVSQMVTISDFFDALRTERPYRRPVEAAAIKKIMSEAGGRDFNPGLVELFWSGLERCSPPDQGSCS